MGSFLRFELIREAQYMRPPYLVRGTINIGACMYVTVLWDTKILLPRYKFDLCLPKRSCNDGGLNTIRV